jgi:outer membrane receptor protein involved in Fe transport
MTNKLLILLMLGWASVAAAQSSTTGAIQGTVTDARTGEKLVGVTVLVSSTSLQGEQTAFTDENGSYKIAPLPPGQYVVSFFYMKLKLERTGVNVGVNRTTPVFQKLDASQAVGGEIVQIEDTAPAIDPNSTTQGVTIDKNYMKNVPVPGRTFEATLGAAAGSQNDGVGVSFSGSSSLENQYYVDGVNTTGLTYGTVGSPVINDFIEEIEVITGGYNAEFGRATGGVVNVVTKSGSNEFKGSIFTTYQPGQLTFSAQETPQNSTSIDVSGDVGYVADIGFELGGPIIKDKLWFFVGVAPRISRTDITRTVKRQTDCRILMDSGELSECLNALPAGGGYADSIADIDPATGFYITDVVDTEVRNNTARQLNTLAKLNYAATPENQGQLTFQALPAYGQAPGIYGPASSGTKGNTLIMDVSGKWTTKLNDNKTEIEAVIGWHRDHIETNPYEAGLASEPLQVLYLSSLGILAEGYNESPAVKAGCKDLGVLGQGDDYPYLEVNCPMESLPYVIGGPGSLTQDTEQRRSAKLGVTHRVKALGNHEFKAGIDIEDNLSDKVRAYSGGAFIENLVQNREVRVRRWVQLLGENGLVEPMGRFTEECRTPDTDSTSPNPPPRRFVCDYISGELGAEGTTIHGNTQNWSAYLRDSWQIRPNLTMNVGLRYEEQRLRYASFLQDRTDPLTGNELDRNAMTLTGLLAPRIGVLYDWTKEGRSKVYAHWGRFYESIPMNINDRAFGGEVNFEQRFNAAECGTNDPKIGGPNGTGCLEEGAAAGTERMIGASGVLIAPGIKPQYMDEIIGGFEYELIDDLKIGVSYQNRRMGRVIEDVSTDGADTYIIANPGEWSDEERRRLERQIEQTTDVDEQNRLLNQLALFNGINTFDKPTRDYHALVFNVTRRFSKQLYVQGSYTFSKTNGNYPGLISYDNGQVDPNISSQYDLVELLANRVGPLPQDRPHYIKVDGYYQFDFKKHGDLTLGTRIRALSGIPQNALAAHYLYGPNESFLLPRGQMGRTDFDHGVDLHVGYGRKLNKTMRLEVFADAYNVYNRQGVAGVDDNYAPSVRQTSSRDRTGGYRQSANPVSGGTYEDLMWVKYIDGDGVQQSAPIGTNPNFRNTNSRYRPGYLQFGARLTF